ncbi:hypothetical protein Stube_07040 [Streptomyces tubercidicus]|uniref:Uncharacterized protein n=1 Tax=Streptomyces tubercidicus TaxID=47759 RepID=A0A640UN19_9ACTN|nr:hypothetical protein Stube_07040 [Streptomyces tubercidicus]
MTVSIADLPVGLRLGGDCAQCLDLFELPCLGALLGNGWELMLREAEVLRDQLTVAGRAGLLPGERTARLTLKFLADSVNETRHSSGMPSCPALRTREPGGCDGNSCSDRSPREGGLRRRRPGGLHPDCLSGPTARDR